MPETFTADSPEQNRKPVRWWPLIVIGTLCLAWLLWVWKGPAVQRQEQVLKTFGGVFASIALALLWLLAFSRLQWKTRIGTLLLLALLVALGASLFRVSGVTGDLMPIVTARWKSGGAAVTSLPRQTGEGGNAKDIQLPAGFAGYPQFLGPTRDGIVAGPTLARDWKAQRPELLWRIPVGEGYSGFAITGKRALSVEQQGANEAVLCRDLFTGARLWSHEYPARFENSLGGIGPRTTPAVSGERVFTVGATGVLCALELSTGKLLWQRNVVTDAGAKAPEWGLSGSPLVVNDLVIVHPGGPGHSLSAYRAATGEPAWSGGDARPGYSSPQLVTLLGEQQLLIFNHKGLASHSLADGKVLWTYPWPPSSQHVTDPRVIAPDRLVVSSGYGAGADLVQLSREPEGAWKTARVWHSRRLKSKFASMVVREGFLYGLDDGRLTCIDLATGEPRWKGDRVGHGQILLAGDLLVVSAENGEVLLMEANPAAARELGRFAALGGKMWNPPALAPPFLIVRTEKEAACYRLPISRVSQ
jgi:outer membrane protein assembly factor BamB